MSIILWNCRGLGSPPTVCMLTEEEKGKNPTLVFLVEMKATTERMKGFQQKLGFTQGIIVPSDGKSGGLAMLRREGVVYVSRVVHTPILMWWSMVKGAKVHGAPQGSMVTPTRVNDKAPDN